MTTYAHIVEGVCLGVGDLPESALRLDTFEIINGLNGPNSGWAVACGYYDIDDPSLLDMLGLTPEQRTAIDVVIDAAVTTLESRREFVDDTMTSSRQFINDNDGYMGEAWVELTTPRTDSAANFLADWPAFQAALQLWKEQIQDIGYTALLELNAVHEQTLLIVPSVAELLETLGIGQVVTMRMDTTPANFLFNGTMVIG